MVVLSVDYRQSKEKEKVAEGRSGRAMDPGGYSHLGQNLT